MKIEYGYNDNLYEEQYSNDEMPKVKKEVWEVIKEKTSYQEISSFTKGWKSKDWYQPDEPDYLQLEIHGRFLLSELEQKFGALSDEDVENIQYDFKENEEMKEFFTEYLEEIKPLEVEYIPSIEMEMAFNREKRELKMEINPNFY